MEPGGGWGTGRCERCGKRTLVAPENSYRVVPDPTPYYAAMQANPYEFW